MGGRLSGRRVVLADAAGFMGPAIAELFAEEGAELIADSRDLAVANAAQNLIREAGRIDVLVVNLAFPYPLTPAHATSDELWQGAFETLVHPLHRLVRATLPQMIERRSGKIIVVGSAAALRGTPNRSFYAAARGAQLAYVRAVGNEVAPYNVQVNGTGQIFVENPTYFSPDYIKTDAFKERLKEVPAGRLATGREAAAFILFLAGPESDFFVGQVFPYSGGFVP